MIVGQKDDVQNEIYESDVLVSTTIFAGKSGQSREISHSVIPKVVFLPNTDLKGCSTKALVSVLNNDESSPAKMSQNQSDSITNLFNVS